MTDARALALDGLHLSVLTGFAIAQPLFDLLGRTPVFFSVRESSGQEIVAFALVLTLLPAGALLLVELIVGLLLGPRLRRAVHLLFFAALVALLSVQLLKHTGLSSGPAPIGLAAVAGAGAAFAYRRRSGARLVLTALAPAPVLFLALFLFHSPVSKLVRPGEARAAVLGVSSNAPIVMVVFDEFSGISLLDEAGEIDAVRFPNFARLARESTWVRNESTVAAWTEKAVPALLTGNFAGPTKLPTLKDHPRNLFTLFGRSHDLRVSETVTRLCPQSLCPRASVATPRHRSESLAADLGLVYLHLVLPEDLSARLPSVTNTWGSFWGGDAEGLYRHPETDFASFVASVGPSSKPTLSYLHVWLPHFPWEYFPSGKRYFAPNDVIPGITGQRWTSARWPVLEGHRRYLLQIGFADRLLGRLLDRLRSTRLYDRTLLVVTADHGISFHPGDGRRMSTPTNVEDIAFVPLFVKAPGQRNGRVIEGAYQSIDVLPTIADVLGISIPWATKGRSILGGSPRARLRIDGRYFTVSSLLLRKAAATKAQSVLFGTGADWSRLFALGPRPELIGRAVSEFPVTRHPTARATIDDADRLRRVDPALPAIPAYIRGRITGERAPTEVAVAVNGRIAGVGEAYRDRGSTRFSFLVPESALVRGDNEVELFAVTSQGRRVALHSLGGSAKTR